MAKQLRGPLALALCILSLISPGLTRRRDTVPGTGPGEMTPATILSFTNITDSLHNTGIGTHGVFFADIDGNNTPDIYITRLWIYPLAEALYINDPVSGRLSEEAQERGAADYDGGSHGACFADLDNDGDFDIVNGTTHAIGRTGPEHNNILINDGSGHFTDITHLSPDIMSTNRETRSTAAFDLDRDGDLDIFTITGYLGSADSASGSNELYLNNGSGVFTSSGGELLKNTRAGQGTTDTDYDGDGDIDIIAANRTGGLVVFRNDNFGNFSLIPPESVMDIPHRAGDGISMGDIDCDGDLDMLLVSEGPPSMAYLYRNNGIGFFLLDRSWSDVSGYMGGFADLDNDSDLDLVFAGDSLCYLNDGHGSFQPGPVLHRPAVKDPRSIAFADIDNDGDIDFAMADRDTIAMLFRNNLVSGNNWLRIKLTSRQGQAGAFGSKVTIYPAYQAGANRLGFRETRSSNGYLAENSPVLHFGLGEHTAVDVIVDFPDGTTARRTNVSANQTLRIDGADVLFRTKIFLEGAFDSTSSRMRTELAAAGQVPLRSPYDSDPRFAVYIPFDAVDWILIEVSHTSAGPVLLSQSALLYDNGRVKDITGRELIPLDLPEGSYVITLRHRNHLRAVTSRPLTLHSSISASYDFSLGADRYEQPRAAKELAPGIWGLTAGNADNSDTMLYASDLVAVEQAIRDGKNGYLQEDTDLNGRVDTADYALCRKNMLQGRYAGGGSQ
ncbi:CRTAC1 family protein [bacterium]|nr:CRTAC1 family protein [bacterium]